MGHCRWKVLPPPPKEHLARTAGLPPLIVQLLYNRGVTDPSQIEPFIAADERLMADPFLLPDMDKAVARIYRALLSGEEIAIYGDFDTDGITATALLTQGLSSLGGMVTPYIPHRFEEGYGLNHTALESLARQGISLVITVDCGITAFPEVEQAQKRGLDIIITDHHSVPAKIPPALAVVNPKRADSCYPFPGLAGVGVAFKLFQALLRGLGKGGQMDELLDLVALGTVADMAPLLGENRYLVKRGLEVLNKTSRPGLLEMVLRAGMRLGSLDTESISWILGPRLNAAGRVDHAITSYKLLSTNSLNEARGLAEELEKKNAERQRLTGEVLAKVRDRLPSVDENLPIIIVSGTDYAAGVVGIVAGKLVEEFYRPSLVIEQGDEISRGSARSIAEFNIIAALKECSDLLTRFGGHPQAAGFTLPTKNIAPLAERLVERAEVELSELDLRPLIPIDAEVPLSSLSGETIGMIKQLAPFGYANPAPIFLSRRVKVEECRSVGSGGEHLRLKLHHGNVAWRGIGFRLGRYMDEIGPYLDIVYNLDVDDWGGSQLLELNILDFTPAL